MTDSTQRILHLAAYDVSDPARLRQALHVLRDYSTGGQKSVFECFLGAAEKKQMIARMTEVMDMEEDRFFLLRLDVRSRVKTLGLGERPVDPSYFYLG